MNARINLPFFLLLLGTPLVHLYSQLTCELQCRVEAACITLHSLSLGRYSISRVGQNHIYTVYIRYFWQGNHCIYGHIRCIYTVLANRKYFCTHNSPVRSNAVEGVLVATPSATEHGFRPPVCACVCVCVSVRVCVCVCVSVRG